MNHRIQYARAAAKAAHSKKIRGQLLFLAIMFLLVAAFIIGIAGHALYGYVFLSVVFWAVYTAVRLTFDILEDLFHL